VAIPYALPRLEAFFFPPPAADEAHRVPLPPPGRRIPPEAPAPTRAPRELGEPPAPRPPAESP
jgi:hypothetical protein